ncbi:MAG: alpha/beta hydrolase [Bacteroidales bacterium]|nr:alpha/beta hydrolase [Bacteroidales bacterium]
MIMRLLFSLLFGLTILSCVAENLVEYPLWPEGTPESNGIADNETTDKNGSYRNVTTASIFVSLASPEKNTGVTLVLCPGGGYQHEAFRHEGADFTQWLNENGINAVVLKYRLPNAHHDIPLKDAQRAIRFLRSKADEWHINPLKIGISGFSAGGHLASTAATHFDSGLADDPDAVNHFSCRPDYCILFYPVISMKPEITHKGSRQNLLGDDVTEELACFYSNELQVSQDTPPTLLFLSHDDRTVVPQNSIEFYSALKEKNVPASLHIFPEGGHGWGFRTSFRYHETFKSLILDWLHQQKLIE